MKLLHVRQRAATLREISVLNLYSLVLEDPLIKALTCRNTQQFGACN